MTYIFSLQFSISSSFILQVVPLFNQKDWTVLMSWKHHLKYSASKLLNVWRQTAKDNYGKITSQGENR